MDPVLAYVGEEASDDVRATLAWLDHMGFQLAHSRGGREDGFGNALLLFTGPADVQVVRDRGQWDITVRPKNDAFYYSLAVLLAANDRADWEPAGAAGESTMPSQLPPGVVWREVLPLVIDGLPNLALLWPPVLLRHEGRRPCSCGCEGRPDDCFPRQLTATC